MSSVFGVIFAIANRSYAYAYAWHTTELIEEIYSPQRQDRKIQSKKQNTLLLLFFDVIIIITITAR